MRKTFVQEQCAMQNCWAVMRKNIYPVKLASTNCAQNAGADCVH